MRQAPLLWAAALLLAACAPPGGSDGPPRILVYTVSAGYEHGVAKRPSADAYCLVERKLAELAERTGDFEVVVRRDAAAFEKEHLADIDVVFFYTTGELPLSEAQFDSLMSFVKDGGGFAGSHCATDTYYERAAYGDMIGGYFDLHPWNQEVAVKVEVADHPATAGLTDGFTIRDEIYQFKAPYSRDRQRVLLSLDTASVDTGLPTVRRTDGDFALAWTREHGKGRVFYTALGHGENVWTDARFLTHLHGGLLWAAGAR